MDKTAPIKITRRQFLALLGAMLGGIGIGGCSLLPSPPTPTPVPVPTPSLTAEETARNFLKAWSGADYNAMYAMLTPSRQTTISASDFVTRYRNVAAEATIAAVKTSVMSTNEGAGEAQIKFSATFETNLVGTIQQDNAMSLRLEDNRWGVLWNPNLIFSQLNSGYSVRFLPLASSRADIFDRKGRPLTAPQTLVSVDVVPSQMKNENAALAVLARVLNKPAGEIKAIYSKYQDDWRTSVGAITPETLKKNPDLDQPGILLDATKEMRTYPNGPLAAHVIGYLRPADDQELEKLRSKGYRNGDIIGKEGLEYWGESYLAGTRGGRLVIMAPGNTVAATLANVPAKQSQNVYSTIDLDVQKIAEEELQKQIEKDKLKAGAAIVMDVSNGNVLAMASYPDYDPNKLTQEYRTLSIDPSAPLFNRAARAELPPGSVFKIVSYCAALETLNSGLTANTRLSDPTGYWDGLGRRWTCWIYYFPRRFHGTLKLSDALAQSCDVIFWEVGRTLNGIDRNLMSKFALGFGLGSETGFELPEAAGNVPDPSKLDTWSAGHAMNLVIGQGYMLTSPLQIASMIAAIANGGTLHKPHIVARISSIADRTEKITQPEVRGKLPISPSTLASLREALKKVTTDPNGTAEFVFQRSKLSVAGKTGTAEVPGDTDAWFAAYTPADNPKIAVVVLVEHTKGGEGSEVAAPIVKNIAERYFGLGGK